MLVIQHTAQSINQSIFLINKLQHPRRTQKQRFSDHLQKKQVQEKSQTRACHPQETVFATRFGTAPPSTITYCYHNTVQHI